MRDNQQQYIKCTYHLTFGLVRATIVAVEKQQVLHILSVCVCVCVCVCRISYTTCSAHSPYCRVWPVWLYNIFPHYHINGTILGKKVGKIEFFFKFYLQLLSETFPIPSRTERYMIINVHRFSCNLPVILVRFYRNLDLLDRF